MTVSEDFTGLTGRFRGELLAHCYRMLGSAEEAEDLVQETYLRAWRSFDGFEGRSSVRTWLYRIATNVCLTAIERRGRRPLPSGLGGPGDPETPVVAGPEVPWLQPFPDALLVADRENPATVTAARAGIRLAFVAALQYLPARQRATLTLDVTSAAQIQAAADQVRSLDILINNAGIALYDDLSDRAVLERHLAVNLFGTYGVIQAFLPRLIRSRGAIVNNVSLMALAPLPLTPAYAISKAAAFNLTQSLRALLAGRGVRVHAVLTGPTDTDMTRGFDIPKASPRSVARAILDAVENGEEDIFPDPMSASVGDSWHGGAVKALERQSAAFVPPRPEAA